ncbi:MFS transporter [Novosphingobium sediminis]|uniref:MFS transporter n=1 Tax=Novosphingobium sediminis TaxID=707214 RepID=A0A512AJP7_9SPHN|nr:MFS transporter [Novosphingobium sediminis]GEN99939.1 MFS transporter [Novosphingobium sediminis]
MAQFSEDEADLPRIDMDRLIDEGRWSTYQKWVLALCTAAILLDGLDNQILGFAMPALMREWGLPRESFVPVVVAGLLIMSIGSGIGGWLGDRAGRRPTLISAVGLFGLTTAASALADNLPMLAGCRFLSTLALGAALPNATALVSEFSPARRRSLSVSISMLAVVLGGLVGGALSAWLLPTYGWRVLFLTAGGLTLGVTAALIALLPESPRILVHRPHRRAELERVLRASGLDLPDHFTIDQPLIAAGGGGVRVLFRPPLLRDTIALSAAFLFGLLGNYLVFNWGPTMLAALGYDLAVSSLGAGAFNLGGIVGALIGALLIDRFGPRWPVLAMAGLGTACAFAVGQMLTGGLHPTSFVVLGFAAAGVFMSGLQVMLFSLAVNAFPATIRAQGVGVTLSLGRIGAVAGSGMGAVIVASGITTFFAVLGLSCLAIGIAVMLVRRPVEGA